MNSTKIAKINNKDMIKPSLVFYGVILCIYILIVFTYNFYKMGSVQGMELATAVFIFICGLCSYKENFIFAKMNGVSRKSFIQGLAISGIVLSFVYAVIDIALFVVFRKFINSTTIYQQLYNIADFNILTLFCNLLFQFLSLASSFLLGILISAIYYRCAKRYKWIVWIVLIAIANINLNVSIFSRAFHYLFAIAPDGKPYMGMITLTASSIIFAVCSMLVTTKAEIK